MFEFHKDKARYFEMQRQSAADFIVPFIQDSIDLSTPKNILEIGSAEAGVLKAFTDLGHRCTGIELSSERVKLAKEFMAKEMAEGQINFLNQNIYDIDTDKDLPFKYDLIILKDVIEHIPQQERFMPKLKDFLAPGGKVFFAFPPWQMPFGGHQQICHNKALGYMPYYHLLPMGVYLAIVRMFGENNGTIRELRDIKETGISIERFERITHEADFQIFKEKFFLINPIYKLKFGLKARDQFAVVNHLPYFRNFVTTAAYYLIG